MEKTPWGAERFSSSQETPAFYGNRMFITAFTMATAYPYPNNTDQSSPCLPQPTSWRTIMILSSQSCLFLPWGLLSLRFPIKHCMHSPYPHTCYMPRQSHFPRFDPTKNIWWRVQIIKLLTEYISPLAIYLVLLRPKYSTQHQIPNTLILHLPPMWVTKFHTHANNQDILQFCLSRYL